MERQRNTQRGRSGGRGGGRGGGLIGGGARGRGGGGRGGNSSRKTTTKTTVTVSGGAKKRVPTSMLTVIMLDRSSSMSTRVDRDGTTRMVAATNGARELLQQLKDRGNEYDVVIVTVFNHTTSVLCAWTHVADLDIDRVLDRIILGGGTAIYDAIGRNISLVNGKKATAGKWQRTVEFFLLTDGEDQHSSSSLAAAKAQLAKPGIANFHMTFVSVGVERRGRAALDELASGVQHVEHIAVQDSADAIRDAYRTVRGAMFRRVETERVEMVRMR